MLVLEGGLFLPILHKKYLSPPTESWWLLLTKVTSSEVGITAVFTVAW